MKKPLAIIIALACAISMCSVVSAEGRYADLENTLFVVDSQPLDPPITAIHTTEWMVPVRGVIENIGGDVSWNNKTKTVTLTRASKTIKLTIGSKTMTVNGKKVKLETGPTTIDGQTYIPLVPVVEQFSQVVPMRKLDENSVQIEVREDFSKLESDSNINMWINGMNAFYRDCCGQSPYNWLVTNRSKEVAQIYREAMSNTWGCDTREEAISLIKRMTSSGHNSGFLYDASVVNSLSDDEYAELIATSEGNDKFMWKYVKDLSAKWGDRGIIAWDLYRMSNLSMWAYLAGYIELTEAIELVRPMAEKMQASFSSWDEANDNYLDGYAYWSRTDVTLEDTEYTRRKQVFAKFREMEKTEGTLYYEELWDTPIK